MKTICVYSFDPGSVNYAVDRVSVKIDTGDKSKYFGISLDWAQVLTPKYETTGGIIFDKNIAGVTNGDYSECYVSWNPRVYDKEKPRIPLQILKSLQDIIRNGDQMQQFRDEISQMLAQKPNEKINILIEPQIDQLDTKSLRMENHDLFVTTYLTLSDDDMVGLKNLNFIQWSGKNKSGMEGKHGKERKHEKPAEIAMEFLRKEGFENKADFIATLPSKKPREDVADAYLQARNFLLATLQAMGYAIPSVESGLVGKNDLSKHKQKTIIDKFLPVPLYMLPTTNTKKRKRVAKEKNQENESNNEEVSEKPKKKRRKKEVEDKAAESKTKAYKASSAIVLVSVHEQHKGDVPNDINNTLTAKTKRNKHKKKSPQKTQKSKMIDLSE